MPGADRPPHGGQETADRAIPRITVSEAPSAADFSAIFRALDDATAPVAGRIRLRPLALLLHDDAGTVVGGLCGRSAYSWLFIEMLVVPALLRGRGLGSALVRRAETVARQRGCIGMQVATFDFQAPLFYQRLGFTPYAVQEDLPPEHRQFYLSKRFGAPVPAAI